MTRHPSARLFSAEEAQRIAALTEYTPRLDLEADLYAYRGRGRRVVERAGAVLFVVDPDAAAELDGIVRSHWNRDPALRNPDLGPVGSLGTEFVALVAVARARAE